MDRADSPIRILIVGVGSAGTRHATNFLALGCQVSLVDIREDRRNRPLPTSSHVARYASIHDALAHEAFTGAVISTPTSLHPRDALDCLERGLSVLVEKPLGLDLRSAASLEGWNKKGNSPSILVGYTWRWSQPLQLVRRLVQEGEIGSPLHASFVMASHLADWHPWESYKDFYMAHASLGGGALLDESHWLDQCIWLFGMPTKVVGTVRTVSTLEISSDDVVDALFFYEPCPLVSVHLDLFTFPARKEIAIAGTEGSIRWDEDSNTVTTTNSKKQTREFVFTSERNDMFLAEAAEFISLLNGSTTASTCSVNDGLNVLKVVEAVRLSDSSQAVQVIQADVS